MFSLDYQIEDLIREISANRYFKERYNTRDLREKIYNRQNELKNFAEQQARKIDWSMYRSEVIRRKLIKYSELGNVGNYRNDDTADLLRLANDITATNDQMMIAFARAVCTVPHGVEIGSKCSLWAYVR